MTVQEFYRVIGSEYEDAARRLGNEAIIRKFVIKFSSDPSFKDLESAFRQGNAEKAFYAAHTLKGVAVNLGFDALYKQTCELTENSEEKPLTIRKLCLRMFSASMDGLSRIFKVWNKPAAI